MRQHLGCDFKKPLNERGKAQWSLWVVTWWRVTADCSTFVFCTHTQTYRSSVPMCSISLWVEVTTKRKNLLKCQLAAKSTPTKFSSQVKGCFVCLCHEYASPPSLQTQEFIFIMSFQNLHRILFSSCMNRKWEEERNLLGFFGCKANWRSPWGKHVEWSMVM